MEITKVPGTLTGTAYSESFEDDGDLDTVESCDKVASLLMLRFKAHLLQAICILSRMSIENPKGFGVPLSGLKRMLAETQKDDPDGSSFEDDTIISYLCMVGFIETEKCRRKSTGEAFLFVRVKSDFVSKWAENEMIKLNQNEREYKQFLCAVQIMGKTDMYDDFERVN